MARKSIQFMAPTMELDGTYGQRPMEFIIFEDPQQTAPRKTTISTALLLTSEQIIGSMNLLTDDERMTIISSFCRYCGCKNPACQCWNDE